LDWANPKLITTDKTAKLIVEYILIMDTPSLIPVP